ncbi:MAG: sugar phosphate nucleotidyltransferase [Acidobacteria bacterium]|nr:sugar phosphate nucleotidyltransferase [Acidobacteriota bacterium]
MSAHAWAVVLAGGDGQRVASLTTGYDGRLIPKQYWSFAGGESMIRWAFARALGVVPRQRVLFVVAEQHRRYWERDLADVPPDNLIVQPRNCGTAAGVLLAAVDVLFHRDPKARLLLLPSDHYVANEPVLRDALLETLRTRGSSHRRILLLGMIPEQCDPDYGWILPAGDGAIAGVAHFVEKPNLDGALALMRRGALVNSFMIVARASALLRACQQSVPDLVRSFVAREEAGTAAVSLSDFYADLPSADLSRDVLTKSASSLAVVRVPPCGWSDLGTPARVSAYQSRHLRTARRPADTSCRTLDANLGATA